MNVILTGLRGTGKSSVGKVLAQRLGFTFVDTDTRIEELAGCRIATIVAQHGWEHFRALERQVVTGVAATDRHVVAAGGGTLIDEENARLPRNAAEVESPMYQPPHLREDRLDVQHALIRANSLGAMVTLGPDGARGRAVAGDGRARRRAGQSGGSV